MPENKLDQFPHQLLHEHHDPSRKTLETGNGTGTHIVGAQRRVQRTPAGK